ncbi:MAG TPA: hypothetical protein DCL77_14885, partial [Prolixibacteraceae bacterium]|nr:hypothetical protein [Prolixibacteraceae bacterium]
MKFKILNLQNLFILLTVLVLWGITAIKIEPLMHYHFQQMGFLTSFEFFKNYSVYPGGLSDYLAEFISQFFSFNFFGSFLIVAVASLQGLIAVDLVTRLVGKGRMAYSIFALVALFGVMVLCDYRYPYYASIRLLSAFVFTWAYYFINKKYPKQSLFCWPVLALLLFYLAGGPALFVYTLSTTAILIYTAKTKTWMKVIPVFLLFAGIVPYLGYKFLFQQSLGNLYRIITVKPPELLAYSTFYQLIAYYTLLPLILFLFLFLVKSPEKEEVIKLKKGKAAPKVSFYKKPYFSLYLQVAVVALLGGFLFMQSHSTFKKNILKIEYFAETEQWIKVIKMAEEIDIYDFRANFQINRAYAHLGQLPERLFDYPQILGVNGLFYDNSNINGSFTMPNSDLYFDLGFMSESQRWAFEGQTLMPNSPRILKRLIMINLINRKYQLAGEFLSVLDQNMLCHDWVSKYQKYVSDTTLTNTDPLIREKRRFNPQTNYVHIEPLEDLKLLFDTNKENSFAYNYGSSQKC